MEGFKDESTAGMPDTMICGCCRFVTSDFEQFREHRKAPCVSIAKPGSFVSLTVIV